MPKISVIMSVYNTNEEWLRESIDSILNQTFLDFEFIIINDGSTNNAEEVILSYKDNRIKYVKQENQGLASALNKGLDIALGEYIARMDSDDISLPERFEKQVKFLDENKDIFILGTWFETFPQKQVIVLPKNVQYLDLLNGCKIGHPTVMFRRTEFEKYNLKYNESFKAAQDYELWSRAIHFFKFANIQEVLLKYRCHEKSISTSKAKVQQNNARLVQEKMMSFLTADANKQQKIWEIIVMAPMKYSLLERIFSVKNSQDKKHKIIMLLGLKIKIRKG